MSLLESQSHRDSHTQALQTKQGFRKLTLLFKSAFLSVKRLKTVATVRSPGNILYPQASNKTMNRARNSKAFVN